MTSSSAFSLFERLVKTILVEDVRTNIRRSKDVAATSVLAKWLSLHKKYLLFSKKTYFLYADSNVNDLSLSIFVHSFVVGAVFILATKAARVFFAVGSNVK